MTVKEIVEKANDVQKVLHLESKAVEEIEKEGDIRISLVIIKDQYFKKKKVNIRKEVYKEAQFDRNVLLSDCNAGEFNSIEYKTTTELEIIMLGVTEKYKVEFTHILTQE